MNNIKLPLPIKIEKARNEIRFHINRISGEYGLDGYILDNLVEAVLNEEKQQRISQMVEMITFESEESESDEVNDEDDVNE